MSFRATNAVVRHSTMRLCARLVLLDLAGRARDDGIAWPTERQIAERIAVSERTVRRVLREAQRVKK